MLIAAFGKHVYERFWNERLHQFQQYSKDKKNKEKK